MRISCRYEMLLVSGTLAGMVVGAAWVYMVCIQ